MGRPDGQNLWLRCTAPFAAYRGFQAGVYRATAPTMPYSAAWGLVLNLASVDVRGPLADGVTPIRPDAPPMRLALGVVATPSVGTLYQHLHSYPVGSSGKELAARTHGAKHWVAPARREILIGLDVVVGVDSPDPAILAAIRDALRGSVGTARYGLPFAGDNNYLFDRIEEVEVPPAAAWYVPLTPDDPPRKGSCRLTVGINRADPSRTRALLVAPAQHRTTSCPPEAWVWVPGAPASPEA